MRSVIYGVSELFSISCFVGIPLSMELMISKLLKQYLRENILSMVILQHLQILIEPEWDEVSDDAKDLVKKLLTFDPARRISAGEAL